MNSLVLVTVVTLLYLGAAGWEISYGKTSTAVLLLGYVIANFGLLMAMAGR